MKKSLITLLLVASCGSVFAADATPSSVDCTQIRKQVKENHDGIDKAYHTNDSCTMGKLMIQNRKMIESNMACFPKLEQLMEQRQKVQSLQ